MTPPATRTQAEAIAELRGEFHAHQEAGNREIESLRREIRQSIRGGDRDSLQTVGLIQRRIDEVERDFNATSERLEARLDKLEKVRAEHVRMALTSFVFPVVVGLLLSLFGTVTYFLVIGAHK